MIEGKLKDLKIKKVICYGYVNVDLDVIGLVLGIWVFVKEYNKELYICFII